MHNKPPPIQWLPAFESSARMLSFRKAADELCVSPPAISQQIKALEDYLDVSLFDRSKRDLSLTEAGATYFREIKPVVDAHNSAYKVLVSSLGPVVLRVSAPIFLAQEILIPNYMSFKEFSTDAELRITTGSELVNLEEEHYDAAIRFGRGDWPNLYSQRVCEVELQLIASTSYLQQNGLERDTLLTEELLDQQVLITLSENLSDWNMAFTNLKGREKIVCDSYFAAMRAAEEGLGIAVGLRPVINRWLEQERVITLHSHALEVSMGYWLISQKKYSASANLEALYRWITHVFSEI